jgi:hypothetical protein
MVGFRKPVDIDVHIIDKPGNDPPFDFYMTSEDKEVGANPERSLMFANGGRWDGFLLRFQLHDETSPKQDFRFMDAGKLSNGHPNPDLTPMWVKTVDSFDEPCPDREFWPTFATFAVQGNNRRLVVINKNPEGSTQKFKFAFLFSRQPSVAGHQLMYDPNGTNTNGPKPLVSRSSSSTAAIAIAGVAVGIALTLLVQAILAG